MTTVLRPRRLHIVENGNHARRRNLAIATRSGSIALHASTRTRLRPLLGFVVDDGLCYSLAVAVPWYSWFTKSLSLAVCCREILHQMGSTKLAHSAVSP